jgi:hypothetical protein
MTYLRVSGFILILDWGVLGQASDPVNIGFESAIETPVRLELLYLHRTAN